MNQPTLGLLEKLRLPAGFKTVAALGATYSLDLLTCMAVLTTMDGSDGERVRYGRIEAYRALDRLRDKVRIAHHAGCISRRDGAKYPSLALLDRLLIPIRLERGGAFHPKVWLVRQLNDDAGRERFVLIVSSRNVTTSTDWDLGLAVEGTVGGKGTSLPRVRVFAEHVLTLGGEPSRITTFGNLDDVRWTLPPHASELVFDFQAGGDIAGQLHAGWNYFPARASRVLILSPFIDATMVGEAATRWNNVPTRRLVAGTDGLITVALGSKREPLRSLCPHQVAPACETADAQEPDACEDLDDEIEQVRALHAKVVAIDDGRRATVVFGSNNLTGAGWRGRNTEAFVRLVGDAALCEPLWDWAGAQAQLFDFPKPGDSPPEQPILEVFRDKLHAIRFRLDEPGQGTPSRLRLVEPPTLDLPSGIRFNVARYTTPGEARPFPNGVSTIELPGCAARERTGFLVCTLAAGDEELSWITDADLDPPLDDERDRELVAYLLGLREFLAYLQSLHSDEPIAGTVEGDDPDGHAPKDTQGYGHSGIGDRMNLEGLLRQLVAEPRRFAEMDGAVLRYGELIRAVESSAEEQRMLFRFREAWAAIREAFVS